MCGSPKSQFKKLGRRLNQSQGLFPKNKIGDQCTIYACKFCKLIFSNPLPIPNSIQDHYNVDPSEYWNENYIIGSENSIDSIVPSLINQFKQLTGRKALDIGAGIGNNYVALQRHGFDSFAIEPSKNFYDFAIQNNEFNTDRFFNVSIEQANFESDYFDFITFGAVLEHLYDPAEAIRLAVKWLKPNGIIQIQVPSSSWLMHKLLNITYIFTANGYVANLSPMHPPYHLYEFSIKSFELLGKQEHFRILEIQNDICDTMLPKYLDVFFKPLMKYTKSGMEWALLLQKTTE